MQINHIKINGFGKIKNKNIEFKDGINIVYGENESGKSTILKFIATMLYGVSKNKNGKTISDFEQYKPWGDSEFSGKMKYTLQNGKSFEVFREFKKKSPIIYNEFGEDISKEFSVGKGKDINFFEQQVKVDEKTFSNTAVIGQQEVKLEKNDTNHIIQKISNLVSTGDDNISFKKSIDKLNKMQNENIGTDRTRNKPINLVNEKIKKLNENKNKLQIYKNSSKNYTNQKQDLALKMQELQDKKEKIKVQNQKAQEHKIQTFQADMKKKVCKILLALCVILSVLSITILRSIIAFIVFVILVIINFILIKKIEKSKVLENEKNIENIEIQAEKIENQINDLKVQDTLLDSERKNIDEKLEELVKIEEELQEQKTIKEELISLDISYQIARECLEKAYEEIQHNISPKFQKNLCEIMANITDGKYNNITLNDEKGVCIEVENGIYMPIERLSIGTIDEMYLSLRLSTLAEISEENLPIILDETFAYFDNQRLRNIMRYLQDKNYDNQIIIFTCSNREENALNDLKIEYNLITLEK